MNKVYNYNVKEKVSNEKTMNREKGSNMNMVKKNRGGIILPNKVLPAVGFKTNEFV